MKKIKIISAFILIISMAVTLFSACKSKETDSATTATQTLQPSFSQIGATDYTYSPIIVETKENETEYIHIVPPVPTFENETKNNITNSKTTNSATNKTTFKNSAGEKVDEISKELTLITKTSPVIKGNSASIIIQGTPGAKYTIDFYKTSDLKADYSGLSEIMADSSGFASWTFTIENDCEPGNRKIIIKEKNTNKFIQTSITVQ